MHFKKIIFFLFFSFLFISPCKAITATVEYQEGFYSNRIGPDKIYSGQMGFLVVEDKVVFCLDPYKIIGDSYEIDNTYFDNYSKENLDYIKLVSIYVDKYIQERNIYYYMAAQELIWERLYGENTVSFTTEKNGTGEEIDLTAFKNEIELYVDNALTKPSFEGTIVKDNFYTVVILEDTNNVLSQYDIVNDSPNNVWINDNRLFVEILSSELANVKLVRKEGNGDPIYYYSSTNQDLAYLNSYVETVSEISAQANNAYNENVVINFLDRKISSLISEAIHFEIVNLDDNKVIVDYETYNGMYYTRLASGNYEIRVKDVPEGYLIADSLNFSIEEDKRLINCSILMYFDRPVGRLNVNVFKEKSEYQLYVKDETSDILLDTFDSTKSFDLELGNYYIIDISTNKKYEINLKYKDAITPIIIYDLDIYPEENDNNKKTEENDEKLENGNNTQNNPNSNENNHINNENQDDNSNDDNGSGSDDETDGKDVDSTDNNNPESEDKDNNSTDDNLDLGNKEDDISNDKVLESDNQEDTNDNKGLDDEPNNNINNENSTNNFSDDKINVEKNEQIVEDKQEKENINNQLSSNNKDNIVDNLNNLETLPNTSNYIKTVKRYLLAILLLGLAIKFKKNEKE